jgi:hypothetical protein
LRWLVKQRRHLLLTGPSLFLLGILSAVIARRLLLTGPTFTSAENIRRNAKERPGACQCWLCRHADPLKQSFIEVAMALKELAPNYLQAGEMDGGEKEELHQGLRSFWNDDEETEDERPPTPPTAVEDREEGKMALAGQPKIAGRKRARKHPSKAARERKRQKRGGKNPSTEEVKRVAKLELRNQKRCIQVHPPSFSVLEDTRRVATGWYGRPAAPELAKALQAQWEKGDMKESLRGMRPIPYTYDERYSLNNKQHPFKDLKC